MNEDVEVIAKVLEKEQRSISVWRDHHRLMILIFSSIVVSMILVMISMGLYNSSGAAQLDLSRPGYSTVRDQARSEKKFDAFPSSGAINEETLADFKAIYDERAKEATAVDAFGGDVLNNAVLGIDPPADPLR